VLSTFFVLFLGVVVAASLFSINEKLNFATRVVHAVSGSRLLPRDNDRLRYLRVRAVAMAAGVLFLELLGRGRSLHLVLLGTDHAPAIVG
jgi:hypothetical protein